MKRCSPSPARSSSLLLILAALISLTVSGCGGGSSAGPSGGDVTFPANLPNYHAPEEWIALIEAAGLQEYADLGRQLVNEGKVIVVTPGTLDSQFNAFSWISDREIWINPPMFSRYPNVGHQATIFLHEMIHITSGEATHNGSWWSVQDQFATYLQTHPAN